MITLQLTQHRKARVWLSELPDAHVNPSNVTERSVQGGHATLQGVRRAAIEVLIPRGPRALYGLLGAELQPNQSAALLIRVLTSRNGGERFPDSIALSSDETFVGLPEEFSQAVIEGATNQIAKVGGLGSGELVFGHAAHGLVGSAPVVFKWLADCLVQLLRKGEGISQEELTEILQGTL
ncbi:MAG: hypothetical protein L0338_11090 [Acidobacteria bacterium]|nr:hypothetical protein [Acidobacteriota bacterium]